MAAERGDIMRTKHITIVGTLVVGAMIGHVLFDSLCLLILALSGFLWVARVLRQHEQLADAQRRIGHGFRDVPPSGHARVS
jgi:hypothetical protein